MNGAVVIKIQEQRGQFLLHYQEEESFFHPDHVGRGPVYISKAAARHVPTGITAVYQATHTLGPPTPERRSWALALCHKEAQRAVSALPRVDMELAEFDRLERKYWDDHVGRPESRRSHGQ